MPAIQGAWLPAYVAGVYNLLRAIHLREIQMDEKLVRKIYQIWEIAQQNTPLNQKSAVCVSTIDNSGYPQSRFVDLKEIDHAGFTFCTSYESEKGKNLAVNSKVSLTAWWDHIGYQIRVIGNALTISDQLAEKYWLTRSKEAQVATKCFNQSEVWESERSLESHFSSSLEASKHSFARPESWGGFTIAPHSIEVLKFKTNRVHTREHYLKEETSWKMRLLQP